MNLAKCTVRRSHPSQKPFTHFYSLCGEILSQSSKAKYLGGIISSNLLWEKQDNAVSQKASNILNFILQNLIYCPQEAKTIIYNSLVHSNVEYCASIWDLIMPRTFTRSSEPTGGPQDWVLATTVRGTVSFSCSLNWAGAAWNTDDRTCGSPWCLR